MNQDELEEVSIIKKENSVNTISFDKTNSFLEDQCHNNSNQVYVSNYISRDALLTHKLIKSNDNIILNQKNQLINTGPLTLNKDTSFNFEKYMSSQNKFEESFLNTLFKLKYSSEANIQNDMNFDNISKTFKKHFDGDESKNYIKDFLIDFYKAEKRTINNNDQELRRKQLIHYSKAIVSNHITEEERKMRLGIFDKGKKERKIVSPLNFKKKIKLENNKISFKDEGNVIKLHKNKNTERQEKFNTNNKRNLSKLKNKHQNKPFEITASSVIVKGINNLKKTKEKVIKSNCLIDKKLENYSKNRSKSYSSKEFQRKNYLLETEASNCKKLYRSASANISKRIKNINHTNQIIKKVEIVEIDLFQTLNNKNINEKEKDLNIQNDNINQTIMTNETEMNIINNSFKEKVKTKQSKNSNYILFTRLELIQEIKRSISTKPNRIIKSPIIIKNKERSYSNYTESFKLKRKEFYKKHEKKVKEISVSLTVKQTLSNKNNISSPFNKKPLKDNKCNLSHDIKNQINNMYQSEIKSKSSINKFFLSASPRDTKKTSNFTSFNFNHNIKISKFNSTSHLSSSYSYAEVLKNFNFVKKSFIRTTSNWSNVKSKYRSLTDPGNLRYNKNN